MVAPAPTPSPKMDVADAAMEGKAVVALAPTPSPKVDVAMEGVEAQHLHPVQR